MPKIFFIKRMRSNRGGVAIMALILAMVMLLVFQSYTSLVMSDIGASESIDRYTQYYGERVAIERVVKEAVLQYYESERMGDSVGGMSSLLNAMLDNMEAGGVTYLAQAPTALPPNDLNFWKHLDSGSYTALNGTFGLTRLTTKLPASVSNRHIGKYIPDTFAPLQVTGTNDYLSFIVSRNFGGETQVQYNYFVRMFQVPVMDYNLIAYAIADEADSIPDVPAALGNDLSAAINGGAISALCLSKLDNNKFNNSLGASNYPYYYRELFSAASSVWEWVFVKNTYMYDGLYPDSSVYAVCPFNLMPENMAISKVTSLNMTAAYSPAAGIDNYRDGNGVIQEEPSTLTTDPATGLGVPGTGYATESTGIWTVDLEYVTDDSSTVDPSIPTAFVKDNYRRVVINIPEVANKAGGCPAGYTVIRDTSVGTANAKPVIIWINATSHEANDYRIYLEGDLTDQELLICVDGHFDKAVGNAHVILTSKDSSKLRGVVMLSPYNSVLDTSGSSLSITGLLAYNGSDNLGYDPVPGVADDTISIQAYASGEGSSIRYLSPRFMLVDVQGQMVLQ